MVEELHKRVQCAYFQLGLLKVEQRQGELFCETPHDGEKLLRACEAPGLSVNDPSGRYAIKAKAAQPTLA